MAHYTGKNLYVEYGGVDISGDYRSLNVDRSVSTYDATAGSDEDTSHLIGVRSATATLQVIVENTSGTAIRHVLHEGASGTLIWGPEGTATGKPKYGFLATTTSMADQIPYDDTVSFSATLEKNGAWLFNFDSDADTF